MLKQRQTITAVAMLIVLGVAAYFVFQNQALKDRDDIAVLNDTGGNNMELLNEDVAAGADASEADRVTAVFCGEERLIDNVEIRGESLPKIFEDIYRDKSIEVDSTIGQPLPHGCFGFAPGPNGPIIGIAVDQPSWMTEDQYFVALYDAEDDFQRADPFNRTLGLYQFDFAERTISYQEVVDGQFYGFATF